MLLLATSAARAEPEATIDWAAGLVTARGIGLADRQAPNPAVARGPSRRKAEQAARAAIARALPALPLAAGGPLSARLTDPQIKARLDRAVVGALTIVAEPETDGSWRVVMAVPIEAVRQALTGPRTLPDAPGDRGPAIMIVDGVAAAPVVGATVGGLAAATLWVTEVPAWAKDAPRVKAGGANRAAPGAIEADIAKATAATLFLLVTGK